MKFDPAWAVTALVALIGGGGFWGWLTERTKRNSAAPADLLTAQTAFQGALNAQAQAFTDTLLRINASLENRVSQLENENDQCRGENAALQSRIDGLEELLRNHGIAIPRRPPPNSLTVIEDGKTTVMTLDRVDRPTDQNRS